MLLGDTDAGLTLATPGATATCPHCDGDLIAKCGTIVTWHWAHRVADCDPWTEPETEWHRRWKSYFLERGHRIEITRTVGGMKHRADVMLTSGAVVELQHGFLDVESIAAREVFWRANGGRMAWIYDADRFAERLHWTERGFWWKHGSQSTATHTAPLWFDLGGQLVRVELGVVERRDSFNDVIGHRVLGKALERIDRSELA